MHYAFNRIPAKLKVKKTADKFGQQYAGIYVGEESEDSNCTNATNTSINDTSNTSPNYLGNHYQGKLISISISKLSYLEWFTLF